MTLVRVLHVDPEPGWGGGEVQVLALLRELAARGVESALAGDAGGALARAAAEAAIPVLPLRVVNHLDLPAALRLRRHARGYDVVHFHTARAHALAPLCRHASRRLVVTRRMDYVPRGGPYARFLYNRAVDRVIAISEGVRRALLQAGVRADRIRLVPSGVDAQACLAAAGSREACRQAWGVPPHALLVLVVAALERRKGHAVLLAAAERLRTEGIDAYYAFCGEGSQAAALRAAAAALADRVRFVGFQRDVARCLAAADVVAVPSLHEGLGVAALEAMAAGRPVVASRVGGLAEAVRAEETGLLVPPAAPEALAAALARLARDPGLRGRLGERGRAWVHAHHSAAKMAAGTLACYEEVRATDR
jgi:glycosyltransferase involved in cell wall biosynthesis